LQPTTAPWQFSVKLRSLEIARADKTMQHHGPSSDSARNLEGRNAPLPLPLPPPRERLKMQGACAKASPHWHTLAFAALLCTQYQSRRPWVVVCAPVASFFAGTPVVSSSVPTPSSPTIDGDRRNRSLGLAMPSDSDAAAATPFAKKGVQHRGKGLMDERGCAGAEKSAQRRARPRPPTHAVTAPPVCPANLNPPRREWFLTPAMPAPEAAPYRTGCGERTSGESVSHSHLVRGCVCPSLSLWSLSAAERTGACGDGAVASSDICQQPTPD